MRARIFKILFLCLHVGLTSHTPAMRVLWPMVFLAMRGAANYVGESELRLVRNGETIVRSGEIRQELAVVVSPSTIVGGGCSAADPCWPAPKTKVAGLDSSSAMDLVKFYGKAVHKRMTNRFTDETLDALWAVDPSSFFLAYPQPGAQTLVAVPSPARQSAGRVPALWSRSAEKRVHNGEQAADEVLPQGIAQSDLVVVLRRSGLLMLWACQISGGKVCFAQLLGGALGQVEDDVRRWTVEPSVHAAARTLLKKVAGDDDHYHLLANFDRYISQRPSAMESEEEGPPTCRLSPADESPDPSPETSPEPSPEPNDDRIGCEGAVALFGRRLPQPRSGPCHLRYEDVASGRINFWDWMTRLMPQWRKAAQAAPPKSAQKTSQWWTSQMARITDVHRAEAPAKGGHAKLLETRHHSTQRVKGLGTCAHMLTHYGARVDAWTSALNVAAWTCRDDLDSNKIGSARRSPTFAVASSAEDEAKSTLYQCAIVKGAMSVSRSQWLFLRSTMECPPWPTIVAATKDLLPGFGAPPPTPPPPAITAPPAGPPPSPPPHAVVATIGLRGEANGAVVDPGWWASMLLAQRPLVEGVMLTGRSLLPEMRKERAGLVFTPRPHQLLISFSDTVEHTQLFATDDPAIAVAKYLAAELGVQVRDVCPNYRGRPRVAAVRADWVPTSSWSALVTVPAQHHRTKLSAAAERLGIQVEGRVLNVGTAVNWDAIGLWVGGTTGTTVIRAAGSLAHCQLRFEVSELQRSFHFAVPFCAVNGDDTFLDLAPHLRAALPSGRTVLQALGDMCNAPFRIPSDWCPMGAEGCGGQGDWLITFCHTTTPDMKSIFSNNGMELKPVGGGAQSISNPVRSSSNAEQSVMPFAVLDGDGFLQSTGPTAGAPWEWSDIFQWTDTGEPVRVAGKATRGLFAQEVATVEHWRPAMKLMSAFSGVSLVTEAAASLRAAADHLRSDVAHRHAGLRSAHGALDALRPLLENRHLPTKVKGGSALTALALALGRKIGKEPRAASSGCSTGSPTRLDGGVVPMLEKELPPLPAADDGDLAPQSGEALPRLLECTAKRLDALVADVMASQLYGDGRHVWSSPETIASDFLADIDQARREQAGAGWPTAHSVGFNEQTVLALKRVESVRFALQSCTAAADHVQSRKCILAEFEAVTKCRFSDRDCTPPSPPTPFARPEAVTTEDCASKEDFSGLAVATPPYTPADGSVCRGRRVKCTFVGHENEVVIYRVLYVASNSDEGNPYLNMRGSAAKDVHGTSLAELKAGRGQMHGDVQELISLVDMAVNAQFGGLDGAAPIARTRTN